TESFPGGGEPRLQTNVYLVNRACRGGSRNFRQKIKKALPGGIVIAWPRAYSSMFTREQTISKSPA
ncbi:MAG: hypothetical protein VX684_06410, partial [Planctomycetota bacterium]|nr:hypothetical protein [Planctomycetota bacterium]